MPRPVQADRARSAPATPRRSSGISSSSRSASTRGSTSTVATFSWGARLTRGTLVPSGDTRQPFGTGKLLFAVSGQGAGNNTRVIEVEPIRLKNRGIPCPTSSPFLCCPSPTWSCCPGMVVPVELDGDARPVVDAAQAGADGPAAARPAPGRPLPDPRRDRHHRAGRPPARRRPRRRAPRRRARPDRLRRPRHRRGPVGRGRDRRRGPASPTTCASSPRSTSGSSSRSCSGATPGRSIDTVQRVTDPSAAGRHGRLRAVPQRRAEARAARDPRGRARG